MAGLALFAYLLVSAHVVSHSSIASVDDAPSNCVACSVGQHSTGIPAALPAEWGSLGNPIAAFVEPPASPARYIDESSFARAPPSLRIAALDTHA